MMKRCFFLMALMTSLAAQAQDESLHMQLKSKFIDGIYKMNDDRFVMLLDIDHFTQFNDAAGHGRGDGRNAGGIHN